MNDHLQESEYNERSHQRPCKGPQKDGSMCRPLSPPPEEISLAPKPQRGFALHPELRHRPGRPKHNNFRVAPKEPGWQRYHPRASLSATDVMAIRASPLRAADQAKFYGVGTGTIRDIRAGRRGRLWQGQRSPIPDGLSPEQLATRLVKEIAALQKRYQRAMRGALARARELRITADHCK